VLQLCRLSSSECYPQKRLIVEELPALDVETDMPVPAKCIKREPDPYDDDFREIKPSNLTLFTHRRLISRRYVFLEHFPSSHAALKSFCGSVVAQDNSNAEYVGTFSNWKNVVIDLSCSTNSHLILPSLLRLITSKDCGISDQALKLCIHGLMSYQKPSDLYALYSAMKALVTFHPRSSQAISCHILENLPKRRSDSIEHIRVYLILDFIISYAELELLHYPKAGHHRSREVGKMLNFDSPLLLRLIEETENRSSDVSLLALLQRAVAAVAKSNVYVDRLVSQLYRLYRRIRCVCDRQQLLSSIAEPRLRLRVAESILRARCDCDVLLPSQNCLSTDSVYVLSSLLTKWLQSRKSVVVGNTTDQIEEYLAVLVTYLESSLCIHEGLMLCSIFPIIYWCLLAVCWS